MTISAVPYAVLTLVIFGLVLVGFGPVLDEMIGYTADDQARGDLPYSSQRQETTMFLLMCWGGLAFVGVFGVVLFLIMNGAQRGSGGI